MALQCNIDGRGKRARLVMGIGMVVVGLGVAGMWAWPRESGVGWGVAGLLVGAGGFTIFESWAGWGAVRAMGFKTRV
jgi:hypothetical protein